MCGLAGFIDPARELGTEALSNAVAGMARMLRHRGPDDGGEWVDPDAGVAIGFRRLAIVDLSPEGHQPMRSASGRYVLAFNGEIYNHADLRRELSAGGMSFRGRSDTEVMLAAFERWGLDEAIRRFVGMFAFALWDRRERQLNLGRDRLGEKPLYYGMVGGTLLFGSELKALRAHPCFRAEVDRNALALYMQYGYVPAPYSIYRDVLKLPPGTTVSIATVPGITPTLPLPKPYWSAARTAAVREASLGDREAVERLTTLLGDAVGQQMVADVPLGAFLSGGIDSSIVVALMQARSSRPVRTFTIGFHEEGFDEADQARAVAAHLGTEHTELYVTSADALNVIPDLPAIYDEPFADASAIPTALVSRLARRHVTVALSGDGGDELFAGYDWYAGVDMLWERLRRLPKPARLAMAGILSGVASNSGGWPASLLQWRLTRWAAPDRAGRLAALLGQVDGPEDVHRLLQLRWINSVPVLGADAVPAADYGWGLSLDPSDPPTRVALADIQTYLHGDILVKVDRASMGASLETRAPLLDHRVVEFALSLSTALKRRDGRGKWPLRQVLLRYVPQALVDRPKRGFNAPIAAWLRGPLRDWGDALLAEDRVRNEGYLDQEPIRRRWLEHQAGCRDWSDQLWFALMFQSWLQVSGR